MPRRGYRKDEADRRIHHVSTYLTQDEFLRFEARWRASGATKAAFVRAALSGAPPRARPSGARRELIAELNRIGVNLNQLTKAVNAGRIDRGFSDQLDAALTEIVATLRGAVQG